MAATACASSASDGRRRSRPRASTPNRASVTPPAAEIGKLCGGVLLRDRDACPEREAPLDLGGPRLRASAAGSTNLDALPEGEAVAYLGGSVLRVWVKPRRIDVLFAIDDDRLVARRA